MAPEVMSWPGTAPTEAHVTVEPGCDTVELTYEDFVVRSKALGWRCSKFDHDDVDGIAGKWFMTRNGAYGDLCVELYSTTQNMEAAGFTVLRAKLEVVTFDTKRGDALGDLL